MKFCYVDESGDETQSDIFTMVGFLIDAYRWRRITRDFDALVSGIRAAHPRNPSEIKTKNLLNGTKGWNRVDPDIRKSFVREACELVVNDGHIYVSALSFEKFRAVDGVDRNHPTRGSYWHAASMYLSCILQKNMQKIAGQKGLTVLIMDDNQAGMPALSDAIYAVDPWFDGLYQLRGTKRGKSIWVPRTEDNRLEQIVNTAFAIKSDHSSLIQIADVLAYVYRRHLEVLAAGEGWPGEADFISELFDLLETKRKKLGQHPDCDAAAFYKGIVPDGWNI